MSFKDTELPKDLPFQAEHDTNMLAINGDLSEIHMKLQDYCKKVVNSEEIHPHDVYGVKLLANMLLRKLNVDDYDYHDQVVKELVG